MTQQQALRGAQLVSIGAAAPKTVITNEDLAQLVDTSDEWISSRTGIKQRRVLQGDETLTDLCVSAARTALERADWPADSLGLIVVATSTPDERYPATAARVQQHLGAVNAFGYDISLACTGFAAAMQTAEQFLKAGTVERALVIGADAHSRVMDWTDRNTCVLFGDGAGAALMQACPAEENGQLATSANLNGEWGSQLYAKVPYGHIPLVDGPGPVNPYVVMNGRDVYKFAVNTVPQSIQAAMQAANVTADDIDWVVMHQANTRIIDAMSERLAIPRERMVVNLHRFGNTSAASIPLALNDAVEDGRIQPGQTLLFCGFGGGLSWTSSVVRWCARYASPAPSADHPAERPLTGCGR